MDISETAPASNRNWLKRYYSLRALFSIAWVALAFTIGRMQPTAGVLLILLYPAWDAFANYLDAQRSGGLAANPSQRFNLIVSALVTLAVAITLTRDFHQVIGVIGIWAMLSGILQLATALRRRGKVGAQWPMILSGAQSTLAGTHFLTKALDPAAHLSVADVAPYAAFGAFYFAVSAGALFFSREK